MFFVVFLIVPIEKLNFQRTIRQRKCSSNGPMLRRTSLLGAIDTVRQWRDTLLSINRERNEECTKGGVTVIEDAIEKDSEIIKLRTITVEPLEFSAKVNYETK